MFTVKIGKAGLEPAWAQCPSDFKSEMSNQFHHSPVYETIITQRVLMVNAGCGNRTHLRRFMRTVHSPDW